VDRTDRVPSQACPHRVLVRKVLHGQIILQVLLFSPVTTIPLAFHTHPFIDDRRCDYKCYVIHTAHVLTSNISSNKCALWYIVYDIYAMNQLLFRHRVSCHPQDFIVTKGYNPAFYCMFRPSWLMQLCYNDSLRIAPRNQNT